jgi:hypothetical protein
MTVDCFNHLQRKKYNLNARFPESKPVVFQYFIGDSDLEHVDEINDLGVLIDNRMITAIYLCGSITKIWSRPV